jgi:hypothetical protein
MNKNMRCLRRYQLQEQRDHFFKNFGLPTIKDRNMRYAITLFFLLSACVLQAQDIRSATLQWNAASVFTIHSGATSKQDANIISRPDRIEWRNADGGLVYSMSILEVNGAWSNVAAKGSIVFEVDTQGNRGTVSFAREAGETKIKITLLKGSEIEAFEFSIINIQAL